MLLGPCPKDGSINETPGHDFLLFLAFIYVWQNKHSATGGWLPQWV